MAGRANVVKEPVRGEPGGASREEPKQQFNVYLPPASQSRGGSSTRSGVAPCSYTVQAALSRSTSRTVPCTPETTREENQMATVSVRYIVDDVDATIAFYCGQLGFAEKMHPAPTFALLTRGELRLALSAPSAAGGGGQAMPDGRRPEPGGWNRFMLEVDDLECAIAPLRASGCRFR